MSVEAYVFITTTNPGPRKACQAIRRLPGIVRADALFGTPDVVALATAGAAGHRRWSLLGGAWFVVGPLAYAVFQLPAQTEPSQPLVSQAAAGQLPVPTARIDPGQGVGEMVTHLLLGRSR